jgi:hypothetical protein
MVFPAPVFPLFVAIENLSFEPVKTVSAPWKAQAAQEPDSVQHARFIAIQSPDTMIPLKQLSHEILTQEPGSSGEEYFHRFLHTASSRLMVGHLWGNRWNKQCISGCTANLKRKPVRSSIHGGSFFETVGGRGVVY